LSVDPNDLPRPFGDFTLLRLIAQGGMGAVYLALRPIDEDESQMRRLPQGQEEVCVVKTVRSDLKADREAVGRFLDEARVVQKLTHPRIARTLEAGIVDKTYFLALEFISGRNLRDVHTRAQKLGRALPEALIVSVLSEMLEALEYAHRLKDPDTGQPLQIVHRDVSPHNVMLGFDGNTRLIDFGLAAHELKRELTRPGVMVGKLRYNAPEQVRDRAIDGRSDVYAAGVVLYEFIANERFYEGLPEEQVWRVAMKGDHRPRSWRDIDIEWRHLLDVALQNDPDKRYSSAGEFRAALLDVAEGRGIDIRNMRREARQFMKEAFEKEQIAEREMILQATGIAEARTQLFRSPSEMQSAIQKIAPRKNTAPAVELKTEILDGNAAQLLDLRNMMSRLADPNAETQLPGDPIYDDDDESSEEDDAYDTNASGYGDSLGEAAASASDAPLSGHRNNSAESSALSDPRDRRYARVGRDDDVIAPTVQGRGRNSRSERNVPTRSLMSERETLDEDERDDSRLNPPVPPASTSPSMSRRSKSASPLPPLPPRQAQKQPSSSSPMWALGLGLLVVVAIGVAAMLLVPKLLKPEPTTLVDNTPILEVDAGWGMPAADAGTAVAATDAGIVVVDAGVADAGTVVVDAGSVGVVEVVEIIDAGVEDAPPKDPVTTTKPKDKPKDPVVTTKPKDPPKDPVTTTKPKDKPKDPVKDPKAGTPPKKVPSGFGEQITFLKTWCTGRVACAANIVGEAKNIMKLTPDELRDLKQSAPKCIEKCQRQ
jgi:serine/threonine protein kinase